MDGSGCEKGLTHADFWRGVAIVKTMQSPSVCRQHCVAIAARARDTRMTDVLPSPAPRKRKVDGERRAEIGRARRARTRAHILAVTFDLFGRENGLFRRIEEICAAAGVTRQTFYNHFNGMDELREALSYEVAHDFLMAVIQKLEAMPDAAERAASAIRFYLRRGAQDPRWAWSIVNISACGIIFGAETFRQAQRTVEEGMAAGVFTIADARLGRDLVLGTTLSALVTQLREETGADYGGRIAAAVLVGLGVESGMAEHLAGRPLPAI